MPEHDIETFLYVDLPITNMATVQNKLYLRSHNFRINSEPQQAIRSRHAKLKMFNMKAPKMCYFVSLRCASKLAPLLIPDFTVNCHE